MKTFQTLGQTLMVAALLLAGTAVPVSDQAPRRLSRARVREQWGHRDIGQTNN